jgi:hypothetical protein
VAGPLPPPLLGNEWFSAGVLRDTRARDAAIDLVHALRGVEPKGVARDRVRAVPTPRR